MTTEGIKIQRILPNAKVPEKQSAGAAGYDIYSTESGQIPPKERRTIRTGLKWSIPSSMLGVVFGRSGLALKKSLEVVDSYIYPDVFDELLVTIINHGNEAFEYGDADRIAQVVFIATSGADLTLVDNLDATERGDLGFGSTGMK